MTINTKPIATILILMVFIMRSETLEHVGGATRSVCSLGGVPRHINGSRLYHNAHPRLAGDTFKVYTICVL